MLIMLQLVSVSSSFDHETFSSLIKKSWVDWIPYMTVMMFTKKIKNILKPRGSIDLFEQHLLISLRQA